MRSEEEFSEWYNAAIERAHLTDKRYPVKGMNVWTGYGFAVMRRIDGLMRAEMERTGHQEVAFPLLIPESEFKKEGEHIKGFEEEVYWVTHAGKNPLDVRLCLRPTSEAAMYPIFALWVRSHADLPLKTFQIVNTYRYDTKQTRAFVRVREIHFFEAHTCHVDFEDAERQIREDLEVMGHLGRGLCLPYLVHRRPDWDKFPGAHYSLAIDTVMPTGKALQIATIHEYRDNFARAFDVKYENSLVLYVPALLHAMGYELDLLAEHGPVEPDVLARKGEERLLVEIREREAEPDDVRTALEMKRAAGDARVALCALGFSAEVRKDLEAAGVEAWDPEALKRLAEPEGFPAFERHSYVHQTTYGMSERLLGAIVGIHGDERGFTLPPRVAPIQAVVVPIPAKGEQARIDAEARKLRDEMGGSLRVHLDDRDVRPGEKYYHWEARGVPLRVEIGPRDLEKGIVTAVRRDTGEKASVPREGLVGHLSALLDAIQGALYARADAALKAAVHSLTALDQAGEGVNEFAWCGREECGRKVEGSTGLAILGTLVGPEPPAATCLVCGQPAKHRAHAARTY